VYKANTISLELKINWDLVTKLFLKVTIPSIIDSIVAARTLRLKLKKDHLDVSGKSSDRISINPVAG
jgi:hypothetical protein